MTPQTSKNLDNFKEAYAHFGYYLFAPGAMGTDGLPDIFFSHGIVKKEISFRQAWEVGPNDLDSVLIDADNEPIIPRGITSPPIRELLEKKKL